MGCPVADGEREAGSVVKDEDMWAIGVVNGADEGTHGGLSMPG